MTGPSTGREASQPRLVRVELRVGNRSGAAHADGRRGHVFAEGDLDEEWPRWFAKALRQRPVPAQFGPFYVYAGPIGGELECVWTNTSTSPEEVAAVDAQRASELAQYGTVANALATRRAELERLETRAVVLQEQISSSESRLARMQQAEESLERTLVDERKRVAEEKASLAAEVRAARDMARQEKQLALDDLTATKQVLREDLTTTVKHLTDLSDGLMTLECKTAENTMARRSLGHSHLQEKLDMLDQFEETHRLALGSAPAETPGDRIANALADTIKSGKIVDMVKEIGKAFRKEKRKDDDDDDDDD